MQNPLYKGLNSGKCGESARALAELQFLRKNELSLEIGSELISFQSFLFKG